jgi:hypothetical protein
LQLTPEAKKAVVQALNETCLTQFSGLAGAGIAVDDQSLPFVKLMSQLPQSAPPMLTPILAVQDGALPPVVGSIHRNCAFNLAFAGRSPPDPWVEASPVKWNFHSPRHTS